MLQKLKRLQEIIVTIPADDDDKLKEEGLRIINELGRDHINDKSTITKNREGTILEPIFMI